MAHPILPPPATTQVHGELLLSNEGLSFWGGVDPHTGKVCDTHHPLHGQSLAGKVLMMPTSRGSCSGSGVLLELALNGHAPAALIFREEESVVTLGAVVAERLFQRLIPVVRVTSNEWQQLAQYDQQPITIRKTGIVLADETTLSFESNSRPHNQDALTLTESEGAMLNGEHGEAVQVAMGILCTMAKNAHAQNFIDVTQGHIDGCIYASPANLTFAEMFKSLGAKVAIPTTMNAISVEMAHWREQNMETEFATGAAALAQAYVDMGVQPSYTCAPYLLPDSPKNGSAIGWSESNAVIYANSVLGARTDKHPDFLDLCIALTGRAPNTGMYLEQSRVAQLILDVSDFEQVDDGFWPLLGYLAGQAAPDRIPLITGVAHLAPSEDDLKGLCAAFGTSSGAPMLHIDGITPECHLVATDAPTRTITQKDFLQAWFHFNPSATNIDLVALGSPHFSLAECRRLVALIQVQQEHSHEHTVESSATITGTPKPSAIGMITLGQAVKQQAQAEGLVDVIKQAGFRLHTDLCWCSISEPVFPPSAQKVLTNSGKYAHYGPGLSGRQVFFAGLETCLNTLQSGRFDAQPPAWLVS